MTMRTWERGRRRIRRRSGRVVVGFAVHRRRGEGELPGVAETSGEGGAFGARMGLYRETRHATLARRSVTPAATRESTTSKAIMSSSQSWLEPSGIGWQR